MIRQQTRPDDDQLRGMHEIQRWTGYSEKAIAVLVESEGFPAAIIAGKWESSKSLITEWRRATILCKSRQAVSEAPCSV